MTAVRQLTQADAAAVAELSAACFDRPWSEATVRDEIGRADRDYLGVFDDERLVAYAGTADLAGELHVMTVAVAPERRRQGLARSLVTELLERGRAAGHAAATLEVRDRDHGARALYAGLGFDAVGRRPGYYGADTAVIMTRSVL